MTVKLGLELQQVSKILGNGARATQAVENFSLSLAVGEIVSLFGPNGCGKSTLLSIAAGLLVPDTGEVLAAKTLGARPSPLIFQDYRRTLLPWLSIRNNVLLPLRLAGCERSERQRFLGQVLEELSIALPLDSRTYQVSGGQAQLACMCRALISEAPVLFLDEPFSALDYFKVQRIVRVLRGALKARGVTVLSVSHDLDEAVLLSDRIIVLEGPPARVVGTVKVSVVGREDRESAQPSLRDIEANRRRVLEIANLAHERVGEVLAVEEE